MDKQVTFTFTISDPDLDGEDIFEQVQMLMYEEFHERADVSYGPPDELVNGDEVLADALARIKRDLTPAQSLKLVKAIWDDNAGEDGETPYAIRVSFVASRPLTLHEVGSLENAVAAQIEDAHIPDEDGEVVRASRLNSPFSVANVVVEVEK